MDGALLLLRLVLGLAMAAHGTQKVFGWFGGGGPRGTGAFFEGLGFRPGIAFALAAGLTEIASGLLLATGFLGPIGAALVLSVMVVAIYTVHLTNGFFATNNGVEVPVLYIVGALAVAFVGPGRYSLDHLLGLDALIPPVAVSLALVCGLLGAVGNLALRRPSLPTPSPRPSIE